MDRWNEWVSAKAKNKVLALRAKKLMELPFDIIETPFLEEELFRLKQALQECK